MEKNYYKTRDISECAVLLIKNQHLLSFERIGKICWFYFAEPTKCKEISNNYFFGEILVNAREFEQIRQKIINRIYSS